MSNNIQAEKNSGFTRHAALFGVSIVAVVGLVSMNVAPDSVRDAVKSVVVDLLAFTLLNPVMSCLAVLVMMVVIVVALFMKGIVKTNRRLDREVILKTRG